MTLFWWVYLFAIACAFLFAYTMAEDLIRQWLRERRKRKAKPVNSSPQTKRGNVIPMHRTWTHRGYDSPGLFRADMRLRRKRLAAKIKEQRRRKIGEIRSIFPNPIPNEEDEECE